MVSLEELIQNLKQLKGTHNVIFEDLFTVEFMTKYTEFVTIDEMFEATGFKLESNEDFDNFPKDELDKFVSAHTRFPSWKEMLNQAGEEYVTRRLGFD